MPVTVKSEDNQLKNLPLPHVLVKKEGEDDQHNPSSPLGLDDIRLSNRDDEEVGSISGHDDFIFDVAGADDDSLCTISEEECSDFYFTQSEERPNDRGCSEEERDDFYFAPDLGFDTWHESYLNDGVDLHCI